MFCKFCKKYYGYKGCAHDTKNHVCTKCGGKGHPKSICREFVHKNEPRYILDPYQLICTYTSTGSSMESTEGKPVLIYTDGYNFYEQLEITKMTSPPVSDTVIIDQTVVQVQSILSTIQDEKVRQVLQHPIYSALKSHYKEQSQKDCQYTTEYKYKLLDLMGSKLGALLVDILKTRHITLTQGKPFVITPRTYREHIIGN